MDQNFEFGSVVESGIVESGIKENGIVEVGPSAYFFEKSHTPKPQQKFAFDEEEFVKKVEYSIEGSSSFISYRGGGR